MKKLNLGIMAHVDAGKTTVTEQFLFKAGATRAVGSVDKGTTWTDSMAVEKERGISVRLATANLVWKDTQINLIDTPGHVDFCAEVERSLRALDAAVLVICAVEGVQAFTITLYEALRELGVPTLIFINKLDRAGADAEAVLAEIERELSGNCVALQVAENEGTGEACSVWCWQEDGALDEVLVERIVETGKYVDVKGVEAGDIVVVSGLSKAQVGDIYGDTEGVPEAYALSAPLLTVQVRPENDTELNNLVHALTELADEDPLLALEWLPDQRELHLNITGWIQIEILEAVLLERFGLVARFEDPSVIYKETPLKAGEGYERYWMPKPCWAILKFAIEPGERGSGVVYDSKVSVDAVALRYQNEIKNTIPKAVKQGIKGWEVTDVKITLIEGEDHNVHTRPGDFITATPMALLNGLTETGTTLLEPILSFSISAPVDLLGTITSDITKMRGSFEGPEVLEDRFVLKGRLPVATSMEYPVQLASRSGGKAKIATRLVAYEPCTDEQGRTTPYRGVSPLDRDKWILQARGALRR